MTTPYKFQDEDTDRLCFQYETPGRAILGWSMGLGKSYGALLSAKKLRIRARPIVIVCPATAKENWKRECSKHFNRPATILYGRRARRLSKGRRIVIVNYDILGVPNKNNERRVWTQELKRIKPEMVILDEIHWVANPAAQRSRACRALVRKIKYRLGLSGTPAPNRPIELWHPLSLIRPDMFPTRWWYAFRFCAGHRGEYGKEDASGASNLDELYGKLTHPTEGVLLRRHKEDVIKDLPKKQNIVYPLVLSKKQLKEYAHARDDFINWLKGRDIRKAMRALRAEAFLKIGYLKRLVAEFKLQQMIDWIEEFLAESDQKLLVFGIHHKILTPIYEHFSKQAVLLTGKTPQKERQKIIDQFNTRKKTRLFIGNIQAGGVAWNCTSASNVAFVEFSFVPADHAQAMDRCHGISRGIKGLPLSVYWLLAQNTIEEKQCETLQKKSNTISKMLDGRKAGPDMQILDVMIEAMKKERRTWKARRKRRLKR